MKGRMITIRTSGRVEVTELRGPPGAQELHELVGGFLERVPFFDTISWPPLSPAVACVAFCDEDYDRKQLPYNLLANELHNDAVAAQPEDVLMHANCLQGTVVILAGDADFLAAL